MKRFYPRHLGPEFAFKRFNAERFLPLPGKLTRVKKRHRTDSEIDVRPAVMSSLQVAAALEVEDPELGHEDPDFELEDAADYIDNLISEPADAFTQSNTTQDLNSSLANVYLDEEEETGEQVCHLGEDFGDIEDAFEVEKRAEYVMELDFESNPLVPFVIEEL